MSNIGNSNKEFKKLKFKYAEYLIGNFKNYNDLIDYINIQFEAKDISKNRKEIISLDRFGIIRHDFYTSKLNIKRKIPRNDLNIKYFILKNNHKLKLYLEKEKLPYIYIAICKDLDLFVSNSTLINQELLLFQGVSKYDIENNTYRLYEYLKALDKKNITKSIKKINPDFITPEEKRNALEQYIIENLENI